MQTEIGSCTGVRAALVVPSFDHGRSVRGVLEGLGRLGLPIIVVDDGSCDDTGDVLSRWAALNPAVSLALLRHPINLGKAAALRSGFEAAAGMGMSHAVTIDADGQLDPADIPALLYLSRSQPNALIVGTRRADTPDCPARCLLGRLFASFAILLQTGLRLSDSQCGLRVYPLELMEGLACRGGRYAFEAEVITRAGWAGCPVLEYPVSCRYFTERERVSHFRPWRDSWAQARMHIRLVARALCPLRGTAPSAARHYRATDVLAWLDPRGAWQRCQGSPLGMLETGAAIGFGIWVGLWPLFGLQILPALFLSWRLHLHPTALLLGLLAVAGPLGGALHGTFAALASTAGVSEPTGAARWAWRLASGLTAGFVVGFAVFWIFVSVGAMLRQVTRFATVRPVAPVSGRAPEGAPGRLAEPAP